MTDPDTNEAASAAGQGSYFPMFLVLGIILAKWLGTGTDDIPVRFRRWYGIQRVTLRKKLGYRDESIYRPGTAGDGSNRRHKRQG